MKKNFYILLTMFLGFLIASVFHALIEIWYINLLLKDFDIYGLGLSWKNWVFIHNILSGIFWLSGLYGGFILGKRWWQIVYIEKRHW